MADFEDALSEEPLIITRPQEDEVFHLGKNETIEWHWSDYINSHEDDCKAALDLQSNKTNPNVQILDVKITGVFTCLVSSLLLDGNSPKAWQI